MSTTMKMPAIFWASRRNDSLLSTDRDPQCMRPIVRSLSPAHNGDVRHGPPGRGYAGTRPRRSPAHPSAGRSAARRRRTTAFVRTRRPRSPAAALGLAAAALLAALTAAVPGRATQSQDADMPWLHVAHPADGSLPYIADAGGRTVILRGANASGFEDDFIRTDGPQQTAPYYPDDPAA